MDKTRISRPDCLPSPLVETLCAVPERQWDTVQEVRLRRDAPLTLTSARQTITLPHIVTDEELQESFWRLCSQAVHTHQAELAQGFVTTPHGWRVGIGGTAVIKDGRITSYRDITSLCIRVARCVRGCAAPLLPYVYTEERIHGLLLCGAPGTGKTTLLRDLASQLGTRCRVAVIDERSELSSPALSMCDVVRGCPKATGILQAVRTLAPDIIVVDELGDEREWASVGQSVFCGVAVVASTHLTSPLDLRLRPFARRLLQHGGFSYTAVLPPRERWDDATIVQRTVEFLEDSGNTGDRVFLRGARDFGGVEACAPRTDVAGVGSSAVTSAWRSGVFGATDPDVARRRA